MGNKPTKLIVNPVDDVPWGAYITLSGRLTDESGKIPLDGKEITLSSSNAPIDWNVAPIPTRTANGGYFRASIPIKKSIAFSDPWGITLRFPGDEEWREKYGNRVGFRTLMHKTQLTLEDTERNVPQGQQITFTAFLIDITANSPLENRDVHFNGNGVIPIDHNPNVTVIPEHRTTVRTNLEGKAAFTGVVPNVISNSWTYQSHFYARGNDDGYYDITDSVIKTFSTIATAGVNIYLKFEVWNKVNRQFESLPKDVTIDIMEYDPISPSDILASGQTDSQGQVHFSFPDIEAIAGEKPDIFFRARTSGMNFAGHRLPDEWSTKGWKATDGSPGYYEDFTGTQIGSAISPIVFRIGLDIHIRLEYLHFPSNTYHIAPKGVLITIYSGGPGAGSIRKKILSSDTNGEVHDVIFDIEASTTIYLHIPFEIKDPSINLPRASVPLFQPGADNAGWTTWWNDADRKYYPNNDHTSLGTQNQPEIFRCTRNGRNVALYFLKILRELSTFLFHMTGGMWTGINNLHLHESSITGIAYSWPVGEVNIPSSDHWNRGTLIHEISHQIMWKEVNSSSLGIAYEAIFGDLETYHWTNLLSNSEHALIEGWAEFMETIFTGTRDPPYNVTRLIDEDKNIVPGGLGPPPNNRGENVEGAFANGLWYLFKNHVVTTGISNNAHIAESINGDVTSNTSWIQNAAVKQKFLSIIWQPLEDLKPLNNPTTTHMIDKIRLRNMTNWHILQVELQAFNMAM